MKIQLKILLPLIIVSILLLPSLTIPNSALADGMIIRPDPYSDRWDYLGESNQQAFINYEDGLEKMILSIGMEETSGNAVWIFPVPSEPNKVVIDVVTQFPKKQNQIYLILKRFYRQPKIIQFLLLIGGEWALINLRQEECWARLWE